MLKKKVLIVEDQKMAQESMINCIQASDRYELADVTTNASMAELFCEGKQIDLILMDVCTEFDESGLDATAVIKRRFPHIKVIIVTSMAEHSFIKRAHQAGADSFWYKDVGQQALLDVMDRTMAGERIYPDRTPEVRLGLTTSYELTERELQVIRALMESSGNEEAAQLLGCSEANIRWHLSNVLSKTGYRNRMELLLAVAQKKLIITDPDKRLRME